MINVRDEFEEAFVRACDDNAHMRHDVQATKIAVITQICNFLTTVPGTFDGEVLHSTTNGHFALLLRYWFLSDTTTVYEVLHDFDAVCFRMNANTKTVP